MKATYGWSVSCNAGPAMVQRWVLAFVLAAVACGGAPPPTARKDPPATERNAPSESGGTGTGAGSESEGEEGTPPAENDKGDTGTTPPKNEPAAFLPVKRLRGALVATPAVSFSDGTQ